MTTIHWRGDAAAVARALMDWIVRQRPDDALARLRQLPDEPRDPRLEQMIQDVIQQLRGIQS